MRAVIYTGGELFAERVAERPAAGDLIIAADAGLCAAQAFGVRPQILLGDFDSLGQPPDPPPAAELLRVPAEKDETDTQLAVSLALSRGATEILIIGGFGGRLDHTLANLSLLENLARRGVPAVATNGAARARFLAGGEAVIPRDVRFRYLSLISADRRAVGVTVSGCKYPLANATLRRDNAGFGTSNEITSPRAVVSVRRGGLWILECRDLLFSREK